MANYYFASVQYTGAKPKKGVQKLPQDSHIFVIHGLEVC